MSVSYMDDNSVPLSENGADSRAMNRNNIVDVSNDGQSENNPQFFSGDPIIEAGLRTHAEQQAKLVRVLKSSQMSGQGNQSAGEAPLIEYDVEQ